MARISGAFLSVLLLVGSLTGAGTQKRGSDLDLARRTLALRARGGEDSPSEVLGTSLAGYSFHREIEVGGGLTVVVISRNLTGNLLVFSTAGKLTAKGDTQEILSIELADLDQDGIDELLTEEVETRGAGMFASRFAVYKVLRGAISFLWKGEAYSEVDLPPAPREERIGFLRVGFAPRAGFYAPELVHVVFDSRARVWTTETVVLRGGSFHKK